MEKKTFRINNVIVNVHNVEKLQKERIESICKEYMARVERNKPQGENKHG